MKQRWKFLRLAARRGWSKLRHPAENLSLALAFLAFFGIPTTLGFVEQAQAVGLAGGVVAGVVVVLFEGAFQIWREVDKDDREAAALRDACMAWHDEVKHFLEVRKTARPPIPSEKMNLPEQLATMRVRGQPGPPPDPEEVEAQRAAEIHDRETVSLYIERYRDRGWYLYDLLVERGALINSERTRNNVRSPKDVFQISDAVSTVWLGAIGDLRRRT